MDSQILSSTIEAGGMVLAAITTGVSLVWSAKRITKREKLQNDLELALKDILAFNEIELALLDETDLSKTAFRETMRQKGIELSGMHTPSLVRRKLRQISQ